ncbi:MAG TPA: hypothetical protein DCR93_24240 [Cytophagales bacterium]|nr:hypothetical protein [Cytophagales bacterium]HAP62471.1 hypothetical protein [Cytophagales bacterium]
MYGQDNEKQSLLCSGKWHLDYFTFDGDTLKSTPSELTNNWVIFHANGTEEVMEEGEKYNGTWEADWVNMVLKTQDRDGTVDQKILELHPATLVLLVKEEYADVVMGFKKLAE